VKDVTVSVPDGFVEQEGGLEGAARELTIASVLRMVRKGTMSAGAGAETLKMPIYDFVGLMADNGMNWYDQSEEELDAELKTLREF